MNKFKKGALVLFVLLSSVLLCTSCFSLLVGDDDGRGAEKISASFKFAPDTSDPSNANIPSIAKSDVSITVKNSEDQIIVEEFFKAGSRRYITVRVPADTILKITAEFSGPKGVWTGETKRSVDYMNYQVIIKLRKVADGVASQNPKPQTGNKINLPPIYFSTVDKYHYKFNGAKNDLKKATFEHYVPTGVKVQTARYCRDNDDNLYVIKDYSDIQKYNKNGKLVASAKPRFYGVISDLMCDSATNEIYALGTRTGEYEEAYAVEILKIEDDLSLKKLLYFKDNAGYGLQRFLGVHNGMIITSSRSEPILHEIFSMDLSSSKPELTRIEFPKKFEYRGGDTPEMEVKDLFMDDKYFYVVGAYSDEPEGRLMTFEYKVTGSDGNKKIKVTDVSTYGCLDAWWASWEGESRASRYNYKKNFYNPSKFVGYKNGYLYIADDGIATKEVGDKLQNVKDVNRIATFNIKTKELSFKTLSGVKWIKEMKFQK